MVKSVNDLLQFAQDRIEVGLAPLLAKPERCRRGVEVSVRPRDIFDQALPQKGHRCQF